MPGGWSRPPRRSLAEEVSTGISRAKDHDALSCRAAVTLYLLIAVADRRSVQIPQTGHFEMSKDRTPGTRGVLSWTGPKLPVGCNRPPSSGLQSATSGVFHSHSSPGHLPLVLMGLRQGSVTT
jgi:hypothetical protein